MSKSRTIPYENICKAVFKADLQPAYTRWISNLSQEELAKFHAVFKRLQKDNTKQRSTTRSICTNQIVASNYTMPEWNILHVKDVVKNREEKVEDPLARPTTSHLTYGNYGYDEMKTARAIPTRTRANDQTQINKSERSKDYMERWNDKMMNTTYRHDICHSGYQRTIHNNTVDQTILIYSKNVLTPEAAERAKQYVDIDLEWTRAFREMCRSLADSIDATAYRNNFTTIKKVNDERFAHPKWSDPVPVSRGLKKSAEAYWETTYNGTYKKTQRTDETYSVIDQHRACYRCPFDQHIQTEKHSTSFRDDFTDHMAHKEDQPLYWEDMRVRIPPGSGVVGNVLGDGNVPK